MTGVRLAQLRISKAGSQVLIFSTGGGHTINHPVMLTIRLTVNRTSFEKTKDTIQLDFSDIFEGASIEAAGVHVCNEILDTASGKLTKCEILKEHNAFAIHRIGINI